MWGTGQWGRTKSGGNTSGGVTATKSLGQSKQPGLDTDEVCVTGTVQVGGVRATEVKETESTTGVETVRLGDVPDSGSS